MLHTPVTDKHNNKKLERRKSASKQEVPKDNPTQPTKTAQVSIDKSHKMSHTSARTENKTGRKKPRSVGKQSAVKAVAEKKESEYKSTIVARRKQKDGKQGLSSEFPYLGKRENDTDGTFAASKLEYSPLSSEYTGRNDAKLTPRLKSSSSIRGKSSREGKGMSMYLITDIKAWDLSYCCTRMHSRLRRKSHQNSQYAPSLS